MRNALKKQLAHFLRAIAEYFPENTRVSAPKGGLCLWVELDNRIDGMELFEQAKGKNISIVPGSLCSATKNFRHCIRLNFGSPWTEKSEKGVQTLGEIISELISEKKDNNLRAIA
jgi:DNA-binding transcriptional MocR family regulator